MDKMVSVKILNMINKWSRSESAQIRLVTNKMQHTI